MANPTEKAQYYIEKSIPDLQELEQKKIFTKDEITAVVKKRTDFEHKVNARGVTPVDFARYVEYELNLEALRKRRIKRLGVKGVHYSGTRRIFFILERGTQRCQGDLRIWMQYLDFARRQKAFKRVSSIYASLVRLFPTKPELWTDAAKYFAQIEGDMTEARGYMQRGMRFCINSLDIRLDYARLELEYIEKLVARRNILGLAQKPAAEKFRGEVDPESGMIDLAGIENAVFEGAEDDLQQLEEQSDALAPILNGAIPMAVFKDAVSKFPGAAAPVRFFELFAAKPRLPCAKDLLNLTLLEIEKYSGNQDRNVVDALILGTLAILPESDEEFPIELSRALKMLFDSLKSIPTSSKIWLSLRWLSRLRKMNADIDEDIALAIQASISRLEGQCLTAVQELPIADREANLLSLIAAAKIPSTDNKEDVFAQSLLAYLGPEIPTQSIQPLTSRQLSVTAT